MKSKPIYRLQAALQRFAPGLCLVGTLGAAAGLHCGSDRGGHVVGFAEATPEAIAPTEITKVAAIHVRVGDEVTPGQIVAELDTSAIDAEIAVAEAEKTRLEADVRAAESEILQKLDSDLASLEREAAKQREEHLQVSAEAKVLDGEMARVKQLVEDRQVVFEELAKVDLQRAAAAALAAEKPRTLKLLAKQIQTAETRRKAAKQEGSATAEKLAADVRFAERNIELLKQRRAGYVLRATRPGRVATITKQPGEVAVAGDPVITVVRGGARVVTCVPERVSLGVREGDAARLWIRGRSGAPLRGKTVALGALVTELPARCWVAPKVPMWGREITVELEEHVDVLAGQAFDVVFEPAAAPPSIPAAAAPPAPPSNNLAASPLPMKVPPALAKRTRFEPSGLLARGAEGRYLVVSDDTGREGDEGTPWLFAMSKDGAIDPEPVRVEGVDELSDVEGIAAGDSGEIYLLSSQSYSKRGKRKPARTALLRLQKDGQGFRVDGAIHLAELLDANPSEAATLGLPNGTRALDIEGLAFRGGALYFGLKAPLDPQGNAMIWRIASPAALFASQPLAKAGASLWARVRVDVDLAGKPTPGGISDLLFLPDGTLALSATPSTADGDAGALFRVEAPEAGALTPILVRKWALKPEGIAPSLSAGKLMVVFDAGNETPSFEEVPWAR
ncbi:esterase-like activity of phytase family protein [Polyangium sp. 6x1]|uniref:esterase-like activity of phytase family protein n=1 Tax=Polyangium sp. 6x1 TaxID=3042689 RepID=UPI0024827D2B|nr:esterase-like activity of phytase family protein [Polyangium sp. 6x1]MDI1451605.1 esterase-like activity of phytase family protein [Polyangium sp. 6x1]